MRVNLKEVETRYFHPATISSAALYNMPSKKEGWNFKWRELTKIEGAYFYKLCLNKSPDKVEGLIMMSIYFDEMVFMNNLELAPHNIGKGKKYENVAGILIAFGCRFSIENGKGNYQGFLTFESKTDLIGLYEKKYGAIRTLGQKMYIDPIQGERLIAQYLT
ncbi:MAG: hypothetical protein SF052_24410 [Bacteroidia bacterium]|nr:hypothetical protein [Bacteroidia bacterium]